MTYLWLRGRHPLLIGFLVLLYGAIAWHFWYVTLPVLALAVSRSILKRAARAGPKNVPTASQNGTPAKALIPKEQERPDSQPATGRSAGHSPK
jgi:hypothetical protein